MTQEISSLMDGELESHEAERAIRGCCADSEAARKWQEYHLISDVLPDLVLLNVEWEPFRCRVRLRGTRAEQFRPIDTTKYIDSSTIFDPGRREDYMAEMKFVATGNRPAFARDWMTTRFGAVREIFAGIWPLAADGTRVDMLVVIEDFAGLSLEEFGIQ